MKIIAIGDNVVDCYVDQGVYYPGGNCVNVAVNSKRNGCEKSAYIGVFGNDHKAEHIKWALGQEGVSFNRSRIMVGKSGQPRVNLTSKGDRVFVGGPKDTVQHLVRLRITPEDLEYITQFDVCHTSCYSSLELELSNIKERCNISFDFSDHIEKKYLERVCPYIKYGFFSGTGLNIDEINNLIDTCHLLGTDIVGVTLGSEGALFSNKGKLYRQRIVPIDVLDTMGAGDSFIAGFLTSYIENKDMEIALDYAANCAAKTCTFNGGFGYPMPFTEEYI